MRGGVLHTKKTTPSGGAMRKANLSDSVVTLVSGESILYTTHCILSIRINSLVELTVLLLLLNSLAVHLIAKTDVLDGESRGGGHSVVGGGRDQTRAVIL
jgi:hypothetical protein